MSHRRIRPFNTRDTYPEQRLANDLAQAVVAGNTVYLRGQVAQDLDTRESVAIGDPAGQAEQAMANVALLLEECGARLEDICKATIYLTDIPDYQAHGREIGRVWRELAGTVYPAMAGIGCTALWQPEALIEILGVAVIPDDRLRLPRA